MCFSQSAGKANSTGFQPSFDICFIDYVSITRGKAQVRQVSTEFDSQDNIKQFVSSFSDTSGYVSKVSPTLASDTVNVQSNPEVSANADVYADSILLINNVAITSLPAGSTGYMTVHHSGKNVIEHLAGVTSEYWIVDTYGNDYITKDYRDISTYGRIGIITKPTGNTYIVDRYRWSSTPYKALQGDFELPLGYTLISGEDAENPGEACVDDLTAPIVSGTVPERNSRLNPIDTTIEFDVIDSVGGVDLGLLEVTISGNLTSQPGGILVVSSGTDQTGGYVSITGDANQYTVTYTPGLDWALGEMITVSVSGQDLIPQDEGQDWSCYTPDIRNVFGDSYFVGINDIEDFGASIVALPDSEAPYLTNITPGQFIREVDAYSSVGFDVVDEITGVDVTTLNIIIDDVALIVAGEVQTSEVTLTIISNGYRFLYNPTVRFGYGETIDVYIDVYDLYELSPNKADIYYHFTIASEDSLIIENFDPSEDSSHLAETKYICADVYDSSFGLLDVYFVINGTTDSGSREALYGTSNLSTTVSGIYTINGASISGTMASGMYITGATVSGSTITNGVISGGSVTSGTIYDLPVPFNLVRLTTVVSGELLSGTVVSGESSDTLISGVNWDGKYIDSYVYDINIQDTLFTGTVTSGTTLSGIIGYGICTHPNNNFDYNEVINVYVHAENANSSSPIIRDELYQLYYGYKVTKHRYDMGYNQDVVVFSRAVNTELIQSRLSNVYTFTSHIQPESDITASIVPSVPWRDMPVSINIHSPTQTYGETISVEFYIEDFEGNVLGPYIFTYTVEDEG
jgi:hypothetical protein